MTGDPRVLAPLQQAFNAADNAHVRQAIIYAWEFETDTRSTVYPRTDERIRAWTPPTAEPSLEQRVAELELKLSAVSATMQEHETDLENFGNQIHELFNRTDPEPTAPDDPVCTNCGRTSDDHRCVADGEGIAKNAGYIPALQPVPDIDAVRTFTITLTMAQLPSLSDCLFEGVANADAEDIAGIEALRDDIQNQLNTYGLKDGGA